MRPLVLALVLTASLVLAAVPAHAGSGAGAYVCNESTSSKIRIVVQADRCGLYGPSNVLVDVCLDRQHLGNGC